ncbi:MAG: 4-hydroxy-tetrahydrodipicolinate reductase [Dehalococcoidales bacterium]|nr:4-hydroxy-tetrahydrodipicolinate reductase [Dehalococcoidales bacterium]
MKPIKVAVHGASGRMGQVMVNALCREPDMQVVGAVDINVTGDHLLLPDNSGTIPFSSNLESILTSTQPDVLVDFSNAQATLPTARIAARQSVNLVIGTTGLKADDINEIDRLTQTHKIGAVVAPNFALGAVLMMHLAKIAGKYMDYVEIIELHHNMKADAPSGTALSTAKAMASARGTAFKRPPPEKGATPPSRGDQVEGISIHAVRLPGLMAHQEVILGGAGQTLIIRHDTINRDCYIPGVVLAIKEVVKKPGLIYGLDKVLGL